QWRMWSWTMASVASVNYSWHVQVIRSGTFERWLTKLRDRRAAARVLIRINRLAEGNPGDVKPVGHGVSELRITYGPGYRVYYLQEGDHLVLLLTGGDKTSQATDIRQAHLIAEEWRKSRT
ncbi:MAG TPA: type II toxin-antitoxin system RelE/ParE family toxin, partial [Phycicoccus sp.]|nr:type II toxin-antitoxin system RelE/ParE family toxin [Phycicoccus sp.]HRA45966.1 type II toxin-antitoxin system RelE/ParE family toxin [Phycicoccus sp.]